MIDFPANAKGPRMLALQISDSMQTALLWTSFGLLAILVRWKDLLILGRKTQREREQASITDQSLIDTKLSSTRRELYENQELRLKQVREDASTARERIGVLESAVQAIKEQYEKQVAITQELQRRNESLIADNARLIAENHQLERRLAGALKKSRHDHAAGEPE